MEELKTEKKHENGTDSSISLDNIYKALGYLKPEQQVIILSTYKLTELYSICANNEEYEKYIRSLFDAAKEYSDRAVALISLHTEAFKQSLKKQVEFNIVDSMGKTYDQLREVDQKKFCVEMLRKKGFFMDAYETMMNVFENAVEIQDDNKMSDAVEK